MLMLITLEPRIHPADSPAIPPQVMLLVEALIFPLSGAAVTLWLFRRRKMSIAAVLHSDSRGIGHAVRIGVLTYLGIMPVFVIANVISIIGLSWLGYPPEPQLTIQLMLDPASPAWFHAALIGLAIIAAPVVEEVIFRGILLPGLMQHLPALPAIVGASLIFAAIHLHLPSLLPMAVLGAGFCVAYITSGSLIAPIVMHAIFNLVNIIALHLVPTGVELPL
jgi:membrane protease YdiL (CAAX protease family)